MRTKMNLVAAAIVLLAALTGSGAIGESQGEGGADDMLDNLNQNGAAVTSGHLLVHRTVTGYARDGSSFGTKDYEAEVWFDGVRARVEQQHPRDEEPSPTWIVFDGERVIRTSPPAFERAWAATPADLRELGRYGITIPYAGPLIQYPLDPALSHSAPLGAHLRADEDQPVQIEGPVQVADSTCHVIVLPPSPMANGTVSERLWACPDKDWAVVKWEDDSRVLSPREVSRVRLVREVEEWLHPMEGLWLPKVVVENRYYTVSTTGEEQLVRHSRTEVLSASFNTPIRDEVFALDLPETTIVEPWIPE